MGFLEKLIHFIRNGADTAKLLAQDAKLIFLDFFSEKKRRIVVGAVAGALVVLIFIAALLSGRSNKGGRQETYDRLAEANTFGQAIPVEELFLPDEPDFVPGVLLERERRLSWSEDDAAQYWHDPLRYGEEQWREKIEAVIDDYMERVP